MNTCGEIMLKIAKLIAGHIVFTYLFINRPLHEPEFCPLARKNVRKEAVYRLSMTD